jgi:hypothetical protein
MATVTPAPRFNHEETQRRVRHPLQLVRKYIRRYIVLEGVALTLLCAALLFWLGLAFDFGLYKFDIDLLGVHGIDWIQELNDVDPSGGSSFWIRVIVLSATIVGLVVLGVSTVVMRWLREFNDQAIALVLERRFHKQLGDRLITAVELADPKLSKRYGYSQAMVEKTILEAVETLKILPVASVFNWGRLVSLWLYVVAATAGMFLVTMAAFCVGSFFTDHPLNPYSFSWKFADAATIWAERNILIMDTYWPRRAYLVIEGFEQSASNPTEMRVARDDARPDLQARALQWVLADRLAPNGWRALYWRDLPGLLDSELVRGVAFPAEFAQWKLGTLDDIAVQMQDESVRIALRGELGPSNCHDQLEAIFAQLGELADEPAMSRTLRKLDIPGSVEFSFRGEDRVINNPVALEKGNVYTFKLDDLKTESTHFRFRVRGEDYYTPPKSITLVAAPTPSAIHLDKEEPAYIYYRLFGIDQSELQGLRYTSKDVPLSTTGDTNTIEVPLGSSLTIKVNTDRKLRAGKAVEVKNPPALDPGYDNYRGSAPAIDADRGGFTLVLSDLTRKHDFTVEFHDEDNIRGKRRFKVLAVIDMEPQLGNLNVFSVNLRKPKFKTQAQPEKEKVKDSQPRDMREQTELAGAFLITPDAQIPLECPVRDDYGLVKVGYQYKVRQVDFEMISQGAKKLPSLEIDQSTRRYRAGLILSNFQFWPGNPLSWRLAPPHIAMSTEMLQQDLRQAQGYKEAYVKAEEFDRLLERKAEKMIHLAELRKKKGSAAAWEFDFKDDDGFDVQKLLPYLKSVNVQDFGQTHYYLQISVQATDNNVETGGEFSEKVGDVVKTLRGNTRKNKNGYVNFLVISENELLSQIALEEEQLFEKLEAAREKIDAGITSLIEQQSKIRTDGVDMDNVLNRMNEIRTALSTAGNNIRDTHQAYDNIYRELVVNRVKADRVAKIQNTIIARLADILVLNPREPHTGSYPKAEDAFAAAHALVENDVNLKRPPDLQLHGPMLADANNKLNKLSYDLNLVLTAMSQGIEESKLIAMLATMERIQAQRTRWYEQRRLEEIERVLNELIGEEKKDQKNKK